MKKRMYLLSIVLVSIISMFIITFNFDKEKEDTMVDENKYESSIAVVYDDITYGWTATKRFMIENSSDEVKYYKIQWTNLINTFSNNEYLTYNMTSTNGGANLKKSVPFSSTKANFDIIKKVEISPNTMQTYTVEFLYNPPTSLVEIGKKFRGIMEIRSIEENIYDITIKSNNQSFGTIEPSEIKIPHGQDGSVELKPNEGYEYADNTCGAKVEGNKLIIENAQEDMNCEVIFEIKKYTVSIGVEGAEYGTVEAPVSKIVNHGSSVTFRVTPYTGYYVLGIAGCTGATYNESTKVLTISNVTNNQTCIVTFGTPEKEFAYQDGSVQEYEVLISGTYTIEAWGGQGANYDGTYIGGRGGYISGSVYLNQGDKLTIYLGGQDGTNGGGVSTNTSTRNGGGSTRIVRNGVTLITGAGGGGAGYQRHGSAGGNGNSAGGVSTGSGAGVAGSNGGGGSSSLLYTYYTGNDCISYTCPSGCSSNGSTCICEHTYFGAADHYVTYDCIDNTWVLVADTGVTQSTNCSPGYSKVYQCSNAAWPGVTCSDTVPFMAHYTCSYSCIGNISTPATCTGYSDTVINYNQNPGNGGASSVGTGVTQITKTDGNQSGNGKAKVSYNL